MTEADKKKLVTLEGVSSLYGDLRGRILGLEEDIADIGSSIQLPLATTAEVLDMMNSVKG